MKTRMKLLDYTLISLLGTLAPAAWAQTATAPAPAPVSAPTDQTVVKIRSEGEAGSVDTSPAGLQAFRRVGDGIPIWVETRLGLEVSGKAREP